MLLSNINFPLAKFRKTSTNINHFPFSNIKSVGSKKVLSSGKMKVLIDGYTYFNSPSHPLEAELHHQEFNTTDDTGIGILPFFHGKNILLTGATGLLGKGLFLLVSCMTYWYTRLLTLIFIHVLHRYNMVYDFQNIWITKKILLSNFLIRTYAIMV